MTLHKYHLPHHLPPALPYFICFLAFITNLYLFQVPADGVPGEGYLPGYAITLSVRVSTYEC